MIVRINQLDAATAELEAGWASAGILGPLPAAAAGLRAMELVIRGQDEQGRPVTDTFRRAQLRQMLPHMAAALCDPGEQVVVRLDGPLTDGELVPAFRWLTDPDGRGRFAVSKVQKLDERPLDTFGSIRIHPSPARLAGLCHDGNLGLERSVRLRVFAVPEACINRLLEVTAADDPRMVEILADTGVVLGTTYGLQSVLILTGRLDAGTVKARIMQRLIAVATAAGQGTPV